MSRNNYFRAFHLEIQDEDQEAQRNITNLIIDLLQKLNRKCPQNGQFDLQPLVLQAMRTPHYIVLLKLQGVAGVGQGTLGENKFDVRLLEEGWNSSNDWTQAYYESNKQKLEQNVSLKKDLTDDQFRKYGQLEELICDFGARYKEGSIEDVEAYFKMLKDEAGDRLLFKAGMARDKFEIMLDFLDDILASEQILPDLILQLKQYVEKIQGQRRRLIDIQNTMQETGHDEFITQICDNLIINGHQKTNAVWVHGTANAGKTEFLKRFKQIYDCAEFKQTRGKFDMKYKHGKIAPSFILLDEGGLDRFFSDRSSYVEAKLFLEGAGIVQETKMKHPQSRWEGVPVLLTSNVLPSIMHQPYQYMNEQDYKFKNRVNNHKAFMSRVKLIEMFQEHDNEETFPYTPEELAIFMLDYIQRNQPQDFDNEETKDSDDEQSIQIDVNHWQQQANANNQQVNRVEQEVIQPRNRTTQAPQTNPNAQNIAQDRMKFLWDKESHTSLELREMNNNIIQEQEQRQEQQTFIDQVNIYQNQQGVNQQNQINSRFNRRTMFEEFPTFRNGPQLTAQDPISYSARQYREDEQGVELGKRQRLRDQNTQNYQLDDTE